jgi:hypothetical protein
MVRFTTGLAPREGSQDADDAAAEKRQASHRQLMEGVTLWLTNTFLSQ